MMKLDTLLGKNKSLKEACENLQTILGIGKTTAVILLAEIPDINAFKNARQLRKAMFFPAFVAKRYNEPIKQFCKNLKKKGKYTFCIVGTAMRKLLQIVFVILKRDVVFNPSLI